MGLLSFFGGKSSEKTTQDLSVTLEKRKELVVDLKKQKNIGDQKAQVVLALDYSGSMSNLYYDGSVQELVERILPLGLAFDDNGEVDFYLFHHGLIALPDPITLQNVGGYIGSKVHGKYQMGSTNYAPIITQIVDDFAGSKPMKYPVYVLFITDGENSDTTATEVAIRRASEYGIFFQFIGIGSSSFSFLEKLDDLSGRVLDNANFTTIPNPKSKSDQELYSLLLKEFPSYLPQARAKGMIV